MIKAIIFDCFGVLTADSWHEFRINLPEAMQIEASLLNQKFCRRELTRQSFLSKVASLTGHTQDEIGMVIDNEQEKNTQIFEYIKQLKQNYKIGLLSNVASDWIKETFLTGEEASLFDTMVFSHEIGMTKPNPGIYEMICYKLSVELREAVMVDDIARNCDAARDVGMEAVLYLDFENFKTQLQLILDSA